MLWFFASGGLRDSKAISYNGLCAGDRSPVLRLRQGYGACTLLPAGTFHKFNSFFRCEYRNRTMLKISPIPSYNSVNI